MSISRRIVISALAACGTLAMCSLDHAAHVVHGVDLTVWVLKATKAPNAKGDNEVDPKLPADLKTELLKAYGWKYRNYLVISSENRQVNMSVDERYQLPSAEWYTLRVTGYRERWIKFRMMQGAKVQSFMITSGKFHFINLGPEPDPTILILAPKLIEENT
jgi:hypothetical protein